MQVVVNQWQATIGCFNVSLRMQSPVKIISRPLSLFQILKLFWVCCCFIAVSIPVLPLAVILQFFMETLSFLFPAEYAVSQLHFMPLFARVYHSADTFIYNTFELFKQIPPGITYFIRNKHLAIKHYLFFYIYFDLGCIICSTLYLQWLFFRKILLSNDVELNPGPETLNFCTWNLKSITAHDFLRISLIEAYNFVYSNDLIGIVKTHLDSKVDEDKLALKVTRL